MKFMKPLFLKTFSAWLSGGRRITPVIHWDFSSSLAKGDFNNYKALILLPFSTVLNSVNNVSFIILFQSVFLYCYHYYSLSAQFLMAHIMSVLLFFFQSVFLYWNIA